MSRRKKKHIIEIEPYGPLRKHRLYRGRIRAVSIENAPDRLRVEIVNLDPRELDRVHIVNLPLPARPGNRTSRFVSACGFDVTVGASIDLDALVNRIVGFRLCDQATGKSEQFDFERIKAAAPAAESTETKTSGNKEAAVPLADHEIPF